MFKCFINLKVMVVLEREDQELSISFRWVEVHLKIELQGPFIHCMKLSVLVEGGFPY